MVVCLSTLQTLVVNKDRLPQKANDAGLEEALQIFQSADTDIPESSKGKLQAL
jgi:hypothetical protein